MRRCIKISRFCILLWELNLMLLHKSFERQMEALGLLQRMEETVALLFSMIPKI